MAVTTLFFGASSAGAADGTTWADRAAFVVTGAVNTLISAFDFTSNSLVARVGPGTHTLTTGIATFTGAAAPSQTFPCILEGALSDGTRWIPPDPDWCSAQPAWDADDAIYPMPVIATTTNISTIDNSSVAIYGLKITASGRNTSAVTSFRWAEWVQIVNSQSNTSAVAITSTASVFARNIYAECSGTSYSAVATFQPANGGASNIRLQGNASASSGDRRGYTTSTNNYFNLQRMTVIDNIGGGIVLTGTGVSTRTAIWNSVIADNGGDGISSSGTSSTLGLVTGCMITGAHTNGINITGTGDAVITNCRFRDYSSAAIAGTLDWNDSPLNGNVTTAGSDSDEYVNAAAGDYRIKSTSTYWGKGIGAGDEPAGGGGPLIGGRLVR